MSDAIKLDGRTDLEDLFKLSGILRFKRLQHTPFLAFIGSDPVKVQIIESADKLLNLPDETPVMVQWSGQWRSDFFQLTVGDVRVAAHRDAAEVMDGILRHD